MRISRVSNGGLARLIQRVERVATGKHRRPVAEAVGEAAVKLIEDGFAEGKAPDGSHWAPTHRGNPPLIGPTLALSTSVTAEPNEDSVEIMVTDAKAIFHQGGTSRQGHQIIPARPMLPEAELPSMWRGPIEEAGSEALRKVLVE